MSSGGGGGTQTTQTIQKADPWAGQQPYLQDVFANAQKLYQTQQPQYYPGQTVAQPGAGTLQAQQYLTNLANTALPQYGSTVQQASTSALNAPNVQNNPYLQSAIEAAINPAVRGFQTAVMPTIRADFGTGENYGSSRRGVATGLASEALANNIFKTASTMGSEAYGQGLEAQSRALALTPQTIAAMQQPAVTMDTVSQQQQAYQQDLINEAMQRWNFEQTSPWQSLTQYQNLIQGNYGGSSTGELTSPAPKSNKALSAVGGAAAGAAIGSVIPGVGTAVGALAGLVLGGLLG